MWSAPIRLYVDASTHLLLIFFILIGLHLATAAMVHPQHPIDTRQHMGGRGAVQHYHIGLSLQALRAHFQQWE